MSLLAPLIARYARIAVACAVTLFANASMAQESLHVYGPGGPGPAMQEAAATYEKAVFANCVGGSLGEPVGVDTGWYGVKAPYFPGAGNEKT